MKDIFLFFKDIPEIQLRDLGPSVKKVIEFRDECVRKKKPLFKQFKETAGFDPLFRSIIEQIGWRESTLLNPLPNQQPEAEQPALGDSSKPAFEDDDEALLGATAAQFIGDLSKRSSEWDDTSPFEIARLRLIGLSIGRSGNDESYLGNHDANLVFLNRNSVELSGKEKRGLIDAGVAGFEYQNVPLWHWVANSDPPHGSLERIKVLAAIGNSQEKRNAVRILQRLNQPTPSIDEFFTSERVIEGWLRTSEPDIDASIVLDFLSTNGNRQDADQLESILGSINQAVRSEAISSIVNIYLRIGLTDAIEKLLTLDPDTLSERAANGLFHKPESISTENLLRLVNLKADVVRRHSATALLARKALTAEIASKMLTDSDFESRLAAANAMADIGQPLDDATARTALASPKTAVRRGINPGTEARWDETFYKIYQRSQLVKQGYERLYQLVEKCGVYDDLELSALYRGFPEQAIEHIRANLEDGFKSYFDERVQDLALRYGSDSKLVSDTLELESFLRKKLTTEAMDAVSKYRSGDDIFLIRKTFDGGNVDFSEEALKYISHFGDWSDAHRILATSSRMFSTDWFLSLDVRSKCVAKALHSVGKHRIIDLLRLEMNIDVKRNVLLYLTQKEMRSLDNSVILELLRNKDDQFRKVVCLICLKSFSNGRIRKLLSKYTEQDQYRYYNCVHWLDLGASMPREMIRPILNFELS